MAIEKESLLPIINEKIETNERDWIFDVEVGPLYEDNKWWWYLVISLRIFVLVISLIFTWISNDYFINCFNIRFTFLGAIFTFLYFQIVNPLFMLLISIVFGQFNFCYLAFCNHFFYKHILSREYILNRIAAKASSKSSLPS
ncbi:unnamed protein product [Cunninghamella echinulata]